MKELEYPFDARYLIKKKKSLKRELLAADTKYIDKKIAVLGGSTTHDIVAMMELFLLNYGIRPSFYESEYNQYWEDVMFDNPELREFAPDIIYIHTTNRNIKDYPKIGMTEEDVNTLLDSEYKRFCVMWEKIENTYHCPVIQNNFDFPSYRILGNADCYNISGRVGFINSLNAKFAQYARDHKDFYIEDIQYLSASYGLDAWADPLYWHMYKYAVSMEAIPTLSYSVACIIKSIYGKNKKALTLDLDNTLWGGIVGDDGPENLAIGPETSMGQAYSEFQEYIKSHKDIGVILTVDSKNDHENAIAGLNHPDATLKEDDFVVIKANWDPKSKNLADTAAELNLLPESFVFVDDNPAEREIIRAQVPGVAIPEIGNVENYIRVIDHAGYFEVTNLSADDAKRNEMYKANAQRAALEASFADYGQYLDSLEMIGIINSFEPVFLDRIAQLTNKSNQFNLTTKRYSRADIEEVADSGEYIDIYGKLIDKFGDNGVVSVVIGHKNGEVLDMDLWIMSCRVLKRDMEFAMMDALVARAKAAGLKKIIGYYYPTAKNNMVRDFYDRMGFSKASEDAEGNTTWEFDLTVPYTDRNTYITVREKQ
ncbi:MAG: HAD-IIIC family phosphatase [Lachnospiraceae bacterium]|nr:HAD-IIIC family phosphatase [Lachnospiraceae bacterium]